MDLQNIQDQLNTEFAKSETRIIFWFDDKGEYEDEVSELQLGDVKLHILDGTNWLYSKYLLNEEDKESKYLVYAAFVKPSDAENPLADMYYYSIPYYTDRVSQMSQEMGIDNRFKEHLSQYVNFWKNKHRIEKFKELGIDHYNAQTIDIGLIAVLTDVKTPNFEEVVKQMMLGDNEKYFKALDDNGLTDKFWELCEKFFGYKSEKPNIDDLSACMILTYASSTLKATVPEAMRSYILKKRNDVVVFIRNIMDNVNYQDAYDKLVERIDKSLRFVTRIQDGLKKDVEKKKDSSLQLADVFACDAFAGLDDIIIDWALEQLNDEILDAQIDGLNIAQVADQRMSKAYHYTPKMECMLSCLPSVTSVGMASLLPHKEMQVDGNLNVTVDGQACASMEQRDKILKSYNENNVALSFDEVANANQTRIRELIQGKNIVYIYHNQVDARGDKPASENEVFNACAEAIEEIHKLVKKLTGYVSAPKFFITADHGFLYKRDRLQEFDKVSYPKDKCLYTNKRFLITEDAVNEQGIMARTMAYLNKLYVDTPVGADIFKVAGGGQNYVHGGTSLQEMIVPVIELTTNTRGVAYDYVDVVLTSVTRKVTNLITYFDFIQTEKVTDTMKARSIVAYFTTEDGEKISFDVPMIANSREDAPEKRTFHEKFTLKSREYKYGDKYYLVLADANDEKNILQQYEFMIDIAFVDDFGF